jgi:hypothetical protein
MYCLFWVVLCIVCVYMCTVLLPPGGYTIAVNRYIIYHEEALAHWGRGGGCCAKKRTVYIMSSVMFASFVSVAAVAYIYALAVHMTMFCVHTFVPQMANSCRNMWQSAHARVCVCVCV